MRNLGQHLRDQWMGALALFLVLTGGSAWAATALTGDSVKSWHIVDGQVKTQDLQRHAVRGWKVADTAIGRRHLRPGAVTEEKLADGVAISGPQGEVGPTGPQGQQGSAGPTGSQGPEGPAGADATTSFAYVAVSDSDASVVFGEGVESATWLAPGASMVEFEQDLTECVVQVTPGIGLPDGGGDSFPRALDVDDIIGSTAFLFADGSTDTSFMITAFC